MVCPRGRRGGIDLGSEGLRGEFSDARDHVHVGGDLSREREEAGELDDGERGARGGVDEEAKCGLEEAFGHSWKGKLLM